MIFSIGQLVDVKLDSNTIIRGRIHATPDILQNNLRQYRVCYLHEDTYIHLLPVPEDIIYTVNENEEL
jgi:hypothetical protein